MPRISGKTRVVAIIGDPVGHSRSPKLQNAMFDALGLDFVYVALRVAPPDLRRAIAGVRALEFAGLNVTVPHKQTILPLLDRLTPQARAIGAVNTVFRRGRSLVGDNTDAEGFRLALAGLGVVPRGKEFLVLGAGGSARAVVWTLARGGAQRIVILNRTRRRASALVRFARSLGARDVSSGSLEHATLPANLTRTDVVVNCTSIGLDGRSVPPLAIRSLRRDAVVYDLVYGEPSTPLVRAVERSGRRAADGKEMLARQAGLSFRLWTGRRPPT